MDNLRATLTPADRRAVDRLAADTGVPVEALLPEIVAAYLRLLRDAPGALPRNPLEPLRSGARSRVRPC